MGGAWAVTRSSHDADDVDAAAVTARVAKVESYAVVGKPPLPELQALIGLAAQICDVPSASISLVTDSVQQVATTVPLPWPGEMHFHDTYDLVTLEGVVIGTLCVHDNLPLGLTADQSGALRSLADRVVDALELRLCSRTLEQVAAELAARQDELRESQRQSAVFAEQVSHDLRNALTSVSMSLQMLEEQPSVAADEDAAWMVARALSGAQHLDSLIERLHASATDGSGTGQT